MKKITLLLIFALFSTTMLLAQSPDKKQNTKTPTLQEKEGKSQTGALKLNDVSTKENQATKKHSEINSENLKASTVATKNKPKQANKNAAKSLSATKPVSKKQQQINQKKNDEK